MIALKSSRFFVSQNEDSTDDIDYKVLIREKVGYKDVTASLTDNEKTELISDLIYSLNYLLNNK